MGSAAQPSLIESLDKGAGDDRPIFHLAPSRGWVNDPNGPLLFNGRYHLFYQHLGNSASWAFGLSWGHCSSSDLVRWRRHPPALRPDKHAPDADGCFSGCAVVAPAAEVAGPEASGDGSSGGGGGSNAMREGAAAGDGGGCEVPVLLYTGVVLRPDAAPGLTPGSLTVSEMCVEHQLAAVAADPGDPLLLDWRKVPQPWLPEPPPGICLNCFRDPFVLERPSPGNGHTWRLMLGAGIRQPAAAASGLPCAGRAAAPAAAAAAGVPLDPAAARLDAAGAALVYSSKQLLSGWQYNGLLCSAQDPEADGRVWECPVLAELPLMQHPPQRAPAGSDPGPTSAGQAAGGSCSRPGCGGEAHGRSHLFSVSIGRSPSIFWLGSYSSSSSDSGGSAGFDMADGPHVLDLGDLLYAPNILRDAAGRLLLWGWVSELVPNPGGCHDYAGCISLPRCLQLDCTGSSAGPVLHQSPLPELSQLRVEPGWVAARLPLQPLEVRHIAGCVPATHFELSLTLRPAADAAAADTSGSQQRSGSPCIAAVVLPPLVDNRQASAAAVAAGLPGPEAGHAGQHSPDSTLPATAAGQQGAVLLYDFATCRLTLVVGDGVGREVVGQPADAPSCHHLPSSAAADLAAAAAGRQQASAGVRVLGGLLRLRPGEALQLRVFVDWSLLEVFTGDGQVLTTRVYRGGAAPAADAAGGRAMAAGEAAQPGDSGGGRGGVHVAALGAAAVVAQEVAMHAMGSAWADDA